MQKFCFGSVVFFISLILTCSAIAGSSDIILKVSIDGKENTLEGKARSEALKVLKEKIASDALAAASSIKKRAVMSRSILLSLDTSTDITVDIHGLNVSVQTDRFCLGWLDDGKFVEKIKTIWNASYPVIRPGTGIPEYRVWKGGCPNPGCAVAKKLDELYSRCNSCGQSNNCSNCSVRYSIMKLTQICKDKCNASW